MVLKFGFKHCETVLEKVQQTRSLMPLKLIILLLCKADFQKAYKKNLRIQIETPHKSSKDPFS